MQFVALFSLVLASVSASAVLRRDGETKNCPVFDSVRPDQATCGKDTFCPGGCVSTVVAENCKQLDTFAPIAGKVGCDGGLAKADGDGYACQGAKVGSVVCMGPFTGSAVCSGCRPATADDKKHLGDYQSPDAPPAANSTPKQPSDKPDGKPAPKTDGKPDDKPAPKSGDKPDDKSGDKPDDKSGDKPDDKSGDKPDDKNAGMPTDHAAGQDVPSTSSMPNATECANQTATPTGAVTTGSATPSPTPDSPSGAEALLASGPVAPAIVALLTAGFSALL